MKHSIAALQDRHDTLLHNAEIARNESNDIVAGLLEDYAKETKDSVSLLSLSEAVEPIVGLNATAGLILGRQLWAVFQPTKEHTPEEMGLILDRITTAGMNAYLDFTNSAPAADDDDLDDELPPRTCNLDGDACESCQ